MIQSICLLGSFRVCADPSVTIPKKGKALLALLAIAALDGDGMSRHQLAKMLWPYLDYHQARHRLRHCLMELRKEMRAEAVKTLITDLVDCRADVSTDVADFARLEKSNNQHDLELAANLYRGDMLGDLWIKSEPFREWLTLEQEMWRVRAMKVLVRLSGIARDNADHPVAIAAARRLVQIDPLNEDNQRLLIVTLDTAGQHGEAKRQYRRCRKTLKEELGIDPDPETRDLAERLFTVKNIQQAKPVEMIWAVERAEEIRDNLDHSASLVEALRIDREVMAKVLSHLEQIIDTKHVGMKSLERMRDAIKHRLGDEHLATAPRHRPQSNGEVGVEVRA
jgi:DNA-binding SARP family transcriptional activator